MDQPAVKLNWTTFVNSSQDVMGETKSNISSDWLQSGVFPLWLAILVLTLLGALLALATLVCSIKFRRKERQLQILRLNLKQQQVLSNQAKGNSCCGPPQKCMCLIALDQQRSRMEMEQRGDTGDVEEGDSRREPDNVESSAA